MAVLAVVVAFALPAQRAEAGDTSSVIQVDGDRIAASAGIQSGARGSGAPRCTWTRLGVEANASDFAVNGPGGEDKGLEAVINGVESALYRVACPEGVTNRWVPLVNTRDLLVDLSDYMEAQLHYPEPVILPFDNDNNWTYVRVPLDFRTTPETMEPIVLSVAAGPPGGPWVEMTATPLGLHFLPNDPTKPGQMTSCNSGFAVAPYNAQRPGPCSYTYKNASTITKSGLFDAQLAITWDVSYNSSNGSGTIDMKPTITDHPIHITEIKALITCTGPRPLQGGC